MKSYQVLGWTLGIELDAMLGPCVSEDGNFISAELYLCGLDDPLQNHLQANAVLIFYILVIFAYCRWWQWWRSNVNMMDQSWCWRRGSPLKLSLEESRQATILFTIVVLS